jgi:hypothetical protein
MEQRESLPKTLLDGAEGITAKGERENLLPPNNYNQILQFRNRIRDKK